MGPSSAPHSELAALAAAATWSPAEPVREVVERADELSQGIRQEVDQRTGTVRRLVRRLRPKQAFTAITGRTRPDVPVR
jgi:hypothetical protein